MMHDDEATDAVSVELYREVLADNVRQAEEIDSLRTERNRERDQFRARIGEKDERIAALEKALAKYRETMECNDPLNARLIDAALNPHASGKAMGREG